eukprot:jgi/Chrpa1/10831/Chrysochromulina_OHIO_Genome00017387-RA
MSSRPVVLTFANATDLAMLLTVFWNVAACTAPHTELTAHLHSIECEAKVFYQAAGQLCSEFAPSGLIDAANGLFIAEQRGTVNMIIFFCTTAKIMYCSQHRIISKLCVTFNPYQIHFLKDHIDDSVSDLRDVQHSFLIALTGKSLASKAAFKSDRPNMQLDLMFDGMDSNEAKTMSLKPEAAMLFYTLMYYVLAHLAAMKDEVHVRVDGATTKMQEFAEWFFAVYPCTTHRSFWLQNYSAFHQLAKTLHKVHVRPFKIEMPIDAVAQLATAALQLFNYSGLPFTYDEIKYTIDAYIDKENLTVPVQLSDLFPGLSPLSLPPPVLITPPPPVTAAGDLMDGEMTVSEVSDQEEEEELELRPTRRSLLRQFNDEAHASASR